MPDGLTHHSDRGSQYLSLRYSARLEEAGVKASVGTVGDSYDNALAESIIGCTKRKSLKDKAGVVQATWSFRHWNGWTGSTSADC